MPDMDGSFHAAAPNLVEVEDLTVRFVTREATVHAVNGVTFSVQPGEVLCILGESGSGKSVTLRALMRLLPPRRAKITGADARSTARMSWRSTVLGCGELRGGLVSMIFQEPMTALDPVYTIGQQITETIIRHKGGTQRGGARARAGFAGAGEDPVGRAAAGQLSARAVGRPAPARDDRHGAVLRTAPAAGRRADHGARRDGADPGADPAAQAAAGTRHGHDLRHPRSGRRQRDRRPHRGDVRRPDRRGRAGRRRPAPIRCIPIRAGCSLPPCMVSRRDRDIDAIPGSPPDLRRLPPGCAFAPRCALAAPECRAAVPEERRPVAGRMARCVRVPDGAVMAGTAGGSGFKPRSTQRTMEDPSP